jgi:hypothetical protein
MTVAAAPPSDVWRWGSRRALLLWLAAGLAAALLFFGAGWIGLPSGAAFSICAFRHVTGIPCPGCGLTRAMAALARGEVLLALQFHPMAPLFAAQAAALWTVIGAAIVRRRPFTVPSRLVGHLIAWQGAALVALWIGRLATGTLPW